MWHEDYRVRVQGVYTMLRNVKKVRRTKAGGHVNKTRFVFRQTTELQVCQETSIFIRELWIIHRDGTVILRFFFFFFFCFLFFFFFFLFWFW
jgi:hypothetical protein